jgi:uncharacterized membrane protein (DUF4010 family)
MFNHFEGRLEAYINNGVMCNRFINGMVNVTFMTHAMPDRAKSVTPLTIVE